MLSDLLAGAVRPLPWPGKLRLLNGLLPQRGERCFAAYGCRFRIDLGESEQRNLYAGEYDAAALRELGKHLPLGGCFVDSRAKVGLLTALAAQRVGSAGQIVAAETHPLAFERLEGMVRGNHLNNVILHHGPLASHDAGNMRSLDSLAESHGLHHVDLLKVGHADLALLAGAARLLGRRRVETIVCEVAEGQDRRILQQVSVMGFRHLRRLGPYHFFRVG